MSFVSSLFAISRSRLAQEKTDKRKDCLSLLWRASLQRLVDSGSAGPPVLPDKRQGVIFLNLFCGQGVNCRQVHLPTKKMNV